MPSWSVGGKWLFGLELRGSSAQDTNLEVIMLAGDSSSHAGPSVGLQPGQASLRKLVRPTSPAERLESSLNGGPSDTRVPDEDTWHGA